MKIDQISQLFENQTKWDFEEPNIGHEKRFIKKLKKLDNKKNTWLSFSIVATIVLGFGLTLFYYLNSQKEEVVFSPQVQETHDYFSSIIKNELETLKKQETPQSKILIIDALKQMESLEKDYENLKKEVIKNGENKQIIYAMITNMQTRISFIKSVLEQVETINKFNISSNENQI